MHKSISVLFHALLLGFAMELQAITKTRDRGLKIINTPTQLAHVKHN